MQLDPKDQLLILEEAMIRRFNVCYVFHVPITFLHSSPGTFGLKFSLESPCKHVGTVV